MAREELKKKLVHKIKERERERERDSPLVISDVTPQRWVTMPFWGFV